MASPSPREVAIGVMTAERARHQARSVDDYSLWECDCGAHVRSMPRHIEGCVLDALTAARRQETCPTCLGNTMKYLDLMYCPNPDCTNGTVDAGSLAVQWLVEAGVIEYEPAWHGPVLSEVAPHVS